MNNVKLFAEGVAQQIKAYLPEKYQNMICEVRIQDKNNGMLRNGIIFKMPGQKLAPVIYMEQFYDMVRKGEPLKQIMEQIAEDCQKAFDLNKQAEKINLEDYTVVKDCLSVQLINTKANQRMLSEVPHKQMEDLSVICRVEFPFGDEEGIGSVKVTDNLLKMWGVDMETVYQTALENSEKNMPPVLMSMGEILVELTNDNYKALNLLEHNGTADMDGGMYILTNPLRLDGAAVLTYPQLPEQLRKVFPQGYYILPSSVHETIIVPKRDGVVPRELGKMVREVNQQELEKEEVLSDRVYEFDKKTGRLCQVPESMERTKERER